jgi:glycosyltransferase involved in cell wall biosynthesis
MLEVHLRNNANVVVSTLPFGLAIWLKLGILLLWKILKGFSMGNLILSVMIPCYDSSATLAACIKSALRDLPRNSEVLIYLDGTDPKASKVVETIKDNRVRVLESHENRGEFHARNKLIENAKGEFVANLDADDLTLRYRFNRQIKLLENGYGDIVFSNAIYLKNRSFITTLRPNFPFPMTHVVSPIALALYDPFVNPTMASRLTTLAGLGGYRDCPAPDYEMWIRAAGKGLRLARDGKYGVLHRVHEKQMTQSLDWQEALKVDGTLLETKRLLWAQLGILKSNGELDLSVARKMLNQTSKLAEIELFGAPKFIKQFISRGIDE